MNRLISRVRQPVKREDAEHYLLLTLLSFAASVTLTRLFLSLSGYPQIGGGELHVAHMLWGGLLLFAARPRATLARSFTECLTGCKKCATVTWTRRSAPT